MFYDNYIYLCNRIGKTPSAVALEIGITKPTVNRWKNGSKPTDATAQKVAEYFGVSIDYLLRDGGEAKAENISGSVIMQGVNGNSTVTNGAQSPASSPEGLTENEAELLRIFRALDLRAKNKALSLLYDLEDESKAKGAEKSE